MKKYKIYANPQGNYEAVKQGWSWPAFFFGCIWAMVKKLWTLGITVLVAFFVVGLVLGATGAGKGAEAMFNVLSIVLNIIFGINGNSWRENNLPKRGYEWKGTVSAENSEGAIALYIRENVQN